MQELRRKIAKLIGQFGRRTLCGIGLVFLLALGTGGRSASAQDFVPHGTVKLEYEDEREKTGDRIIDRTTFTQEYELKIDGYVWRQDFLTFQTIFSYDDSLEDDSDQGDSRDRDIDLYEITTNLFPQWPTPLTLYVKRNLILLDAEESSDSETEEDTYRINWRILYDKLPDMEFKFERFDDKTTDSDAGITTTTTDDQDDTFTFTASETFWGMLQLKFEYEKDIERDQLVGTENTLDSYILTGTAELASNLRVDIRAEYSDERIESLSLLTDLDIRERIDSVTSVIFYDKNDIPRDHEIAVPLNVSTGDPDFTGWNSGVVQDPATYEVARSEITFDDAPSTGDVIVIEYATEDLRRYFDIYLGDDSKETFPLTVTKVNVETTESFMVFAEYITLDGGKVALGFSKADDAEPISRTFPIEDVDVTIAYNTRSGNFVEDDFTNTTIEETGTSFTLSRVSTVEEILEPELIDERLVEVEVNYIPTASFDVYLNYEFDETRENLLTTTEHSAEVRTRYTLTEGLINKTEVSYDLDTFEAKLDPSTEIEEWDFTTEMDYTRPLGWAKLTSDYTFEREERKESELAELRATSDRTTHSVGVELLMGKTKVNNEFEYEREDTDDKLAGEVSWRKEYNYELKVTNRQSFKGVTLDTTLEYEYELETEKDKDDSKITTYEIEEKLKYKALSFDTSLEYEDESSGEKWSKEWISDSELQYRPFTWLDLKSGLEWTRTKNDQEEGTETIYFVEGEVRYKLPGPTSLDFGVRQEWLSDDLGEDEESLELDAKLSYIYAKVKATLEFDYDRTDYGGESDDTEDTSVKFTLERSF